MTDVYVKSFTHLKDRRRADDALKLLQKDCFVGEAHHEEERMGLARPRRVFP
jgi:hypothetical protein